jgi:hypothetical protein
MFAASSRLSAMFASDEINVSYFVGGDIAPDQFARVRNALGLVPANSPSACPVHSRPSRRVAADGVSR